MDGGAVSPKGEYERRVGELSARRSLLQSRERLAGYTQLALAILALGWILFRLSRLGSADLLVLVPIGVFVAVAAVHSRLTRASTLCTRGIRFYEQGLARLDGGWMGKGNMGERFLEPSHPYARDLDLFGHGSVFELMCTARTRAGEEALARWLLQAASPDRTRARQAAVAELSGRLGFRECLATLGEDVGLGVHPQELVAWGEAEAVFPAGILRIFVPLLAVIWLLSVIAWGIWGAPWVLVMATSLVNIGVSFFVHQRLDQATHAAEEAGHDLDLLAQVLGAFEREPLTSPNLRELLEHLKQGDVLPSLAVAQLRWRVESLESAHNLFVRAFDPVVFYRLQFVFSAERWRKRYGRLLRVWLDAIGQLEALAALGGYAYENPADVFPEFVETAPCFDARGLAHPLLPRARAVANDLRLGRDLQLIIVSGPNMAGKSTFLRGIGVNAVLAQCGAPVRAASLKLSPLQVTASICVLDSLEGGISRFYAEIRRLKQIMDLTGGSIPVLFLLDELLSGTNSHDRLIGTRSFLSKMVERGAIGLVSTHDLALTAIPDTIGPQAINCHFKDHFEKGLLRFDYKMYPGIVQTSNALTLMRSIGLEV